MSTNAIRNAIVEAMETVGAIGKVHPFERYTADQKKLAEIYQESGRVNGWYVSRGAMREVEDSGDTNMEITDWKIVGYLSLLDGEQSELAFDLLIDQLRAVFRNDETLSGAVWQLGDPDRDDETGLQIERLGPVLFCGVLCHEARLRLTTLSKVGVGAEAVSDLNLVNVKWDWADPSTQQGPDGKTDAEDNIQTGGA
ncbi:hypothetical protein [Ferrovibrio terrae]|uniref:hypothetical protein n=1 Tax=Ferrovibrio terrae TaxID=2594003 RepID=UPI003137DD46